MLRGQKIGGLYWATIWNFLTFLSVLIIFAQSLVGLSYRGQNASVYEQVAGEVEDDVPGTSSPNRKYVRGIEHVPGSGQTHTETGDDGDRDDEDEDGVTRETDPTEITPLMHQHRSYGPDGRVVVDSVDDSREYKHPYTATVPYKPTRRTTYYPGTAGRRNYLVDCTNDPQCPHPCTARLRNYLPLIGCVAPDFD